MRISNGVYAVSTLTGTIIGVGLFSLPYIASKVGFWVMLAYFLFLGAIAFIIHWIFGQLALETPDYKRMPGFAKIYLGNWGEKVSYASTILGLLGATLAYLIIGGEFLSALLSPLFGGGGVLWTLVYFSAGALLIFVGIKSIAKVEFWGLVLFFITLLLIFSRGLPHFNAAYLFPNIDTKSLFLPYGVILFSLWGVSLVPEIEEMLGKNKRMIRSVILASILISLIVYIFFVFATLGITGPDTTREAIAGLQRAIGNGTVYLGFFFGLITTFTSFIIVGLTLRKVFWYDLKIPKNLSWAICCFVPLFLFLAGIKDFISVISFVGGVLLGIDGMLILLMYKKFIGNKTERASGKMRFVIYPLLLIFLAGIIYEIIYFRISEF